MVVHSNFTINKNIYFYQTLRIYVVMRRFIFTHRWCGFPTKFDMRRLSYDRMNFRDDVEVLGSWACFFWIKCVYLWVLLVPTVLLGVVIVMLCYKCALLFASYCSLLMAMLLEFYLTLMMCFHSVSEAARCFECCQPVAFFNWAVLVIADTGCDMYYTLVGGIEYCRLLIEQYCRLLIELCRLFRAETQLLFAQSSLGIFITLVLVLGCCRILSRFIQKEFPNLNNQWSNHPVLDQIHRKIEIWKTKKLLSASDLGHGEIPDEIIGFVY